MSDTKADQHRRVTSAFDRNSTALEVVAGKNLTGKTAIVTGGASGIGIETARALAVAGAQVTIAVRDLNAGREVADKLNAEVGRQAVTVEKLDLASLASVRGFAKRWGDKPLNLLINNAGVMACPQAYTEDGFEMQLGTNHLGHFLLAMLLTPNLVKAAPSRLVVLSSSAHSHSDIDFDDPHYRKRPYHPFKAYGQSKTANALFALEYDRRFKDQGVRAFSLMPGVIATPLLRHMTPQLNAELGVAPAAKPGDPPPRQLHRKTPEQGASTTIWAAVGPELEGQGGLYLEDCNEALPFGEADEPGRGVKDYALNPESARKLWEMSERDVGLSAGA